MVADHQLLMYCLNCHYSLVGLDSARCPECGREFDPGNPTTFAESLVQGRELLRRVLIGIGALLSPLWLWLAILVLKAGAVDFSYSITNRMIFPCAFVAIYGWLICVSSGRSSWKVLRNKGVAIVDRPKWRAAVGLAVLFAMIPILYLLVLIVLMFCVFVMFD